MDEWADPSADLSSLQPAEIDELTRRVQDIERGYREVAEKVGQLYMRADEYRLDELTTQLDQPMRLAAANEQTFAALLDELRQLQKKRRARG